MKIAESSGGWGDLWECIGLVLGIIGYLIIGFAIVAAAACLFWFEIIKMIFGDCVKFDHKGSNW